MKKHFVPGGRKHLVMSDGRRGQVSQAAGRAWQGHQPGGAPLGFLT